MKLHQWQDVDDRGRIERVEYTTKNAKGEPWAKYANVYVPYGYDAARPYPVLYLMHGGGGNPDAWLDASQVKNALDQVFSRGEAEPFLVVFPTYYSLRPSDHRSERVDAAFEDAQVRFFQQELAADLIPAVEGRYATYAQGDTSAEGLKRSRAYRAFGGFSMGGATTWYVFLHHLDIVSAFLPLSGDCWAVEPRGGKDEAVRTAALLAEAAKSSGYGPAGFRIFAGTGSADIAYENLLPQIEEMKKHGDIFVYEEDPARGNLHFSLKDGAPHAYEEVYHHLYHYLPVLFA